MKALILGAGGMLGHKVCQHLSRCGDVEVFGTVRQTAESWDRFAPVFGTTRILGRVDVLEGGALEAVVAEVQPDVVVNCVGIVKQSSQAEDRFLSVAVNSMLPHRLARLCAATGGRLIHISTDCVFDGSRGRYVESDDSDARDLYGRSKFLGETDRSECAAMTLRTSIIGRELTRPTHGLIEWFLAERGSRVKGYANAVFTGFTTLELARIIERVAREGEHLCGVYHVASDRISKYDLLLLVREHVGVDIGIDRDSTFACDRSLVMDRFTEAIGYRPPSWDEMIRAMAVDVTPYETL